MRVVGTRWFTTLLLMIAAGSSRPARADQPAGKPSPPPPTASPAAPPPLTSVSPPAGPPAATSTPPAATSAPPAATAAPPAPTAPDAPPLPAPSGQPPSALPRPPGAAPPPPVYWYPPPPGYLPPYDWGQAGQKREHQRTRLPKLVTHKPGMPVYEGYHLEDRRPRWPLVVGLPTFGIGYLGSIFIGLIAGPISQDEDTWAPMYVPIVGPFITLETAKKTIEFDGERVVMAAMGGFQIAGLAITALHFLYPTKKMLVRDGKIEIRPASFAGTTGLAAHF